MAPFVTLWTVLGIILLKYNVLATDSTKPETKIDTLGQEDANKIVKRSESDVEYADEKRNIGRWRNANWAYGGGKRNFGRWRHRNWSNGRVRRSELDGYDTNTFMDDNPNKRFSDDLDLNGYDLGDLYGSGYFGESGYALPSYAVNEFTDKRQASRWNLIHRKLAELNREGKRSFDDFEGLDEDKRSPGRWMLIQRKLNELNRNENKSKRFAGRWKNQNWLLSQRNNKNAEQAEKPHSVQKRFIGRWKNNNWLLQQRSEHA